MSEQSEFYNKEFRKSISTLEKQRDKYKRAIDEIEEYCKDENLKHNYTDGVILDIINKVKEH